MIVDILLACKKKITTQKIKMLSNRPYEKPEVELGCPRMVSNSCFLQNSYVERSYSIALELQVIHI
jgi:hypothetical protein